LHCAVAAPRKGFFAYRYEGNRHDCGSKLGFLQAMVDLGMKHPEVGAEFTEWRQSR
jgi:UTP--glucose-1-phosphate uridylyltransferase